MSEKYIWPIEPQYKVLEHDKYGLRNIEGMLIVREQYTFISRYYNGYQAWSYGNCDFYDKYGNLLLTSVPI